MDTLLYKCVVMYVFGTLRYIYLFWYSIWIAVIFNAVKVQAMNENFHFQNSPESYFSKTLFTLMNFKTLA